MRKPKLTVALEEFSRAWRTLYRYKRRKRGQIGIGYRDGRLEVELIDIVSAVPAKGHWPGKAWIDIRSLKFVKLEALPDPVVLRVESGNLCMGPYRLICEWMPVIHLRESDPNPSTPAPERRIRRIVNDHGRVKLAILASKARDELPGAQVEMAEFGYTVKWGEREGALILVEPNEIEFRTFSLAPGETYHESKTRHWKRLPHEYIESWGMDNIIIELKRAIASRGT
jgi:hypothetical protein